MIAPVVSAFELSPIPQVFAVVYRLFGVIHEIVVIYQVVIGFYQVNSYSIFEEGIFDDLVLIRSCRQQKPAPIVMGKYVACDQIVSRFNQENPVELVVTNLVFDDLVVARVIDPHAVASRDVVFLDRVAL